MSEETVTRAAVVTGGSRGIGRAVCVALAKQGCNVVVNYCHGAEPAEQTAALCRAEGVDAVAVQADVSTAEGCKTLFDAAVNAFGRVDVLVNNAGITRDGLLLRIMFLPESTMNGYQLKSNQSVHYGPQTALLPELFLYFQSSLTLF